MASNPFPSIDVANEIGGKNQSNFQSYSTMLLSFSIESTLKEPIILNNFSEIERYPALLSNKYLLNVVQAYFSNYGNKLYLLAQPNNLIVHDMSKYTHFLESNCDNLEDIEIIIAIDLFEQEFTDDKLQNIQNTISEYCNNAHLISISDLPQENFELYSNALYDTVSFYPWIKNDNMNMIPPSIYGAALCSSMATLNSIEETIANKYIEYISDTHIKIDDNLLLKLNNLNITPIVFERSQGYKFWGIKTLNFQDKDLAYFNVLRVMRYIKRSIIKISRDYLFEPNSISLKNVILRRVDVFLTNLWNLGVLSGKSEEDAFLINYLNFNENIDENTIAIEIGVYIERLVEFVSIRIIRKTPYENEKSSLELI